MQIHISVESQPDAATNNSGSFLIDARIDRATWNEMKARGAWYLDADELEDLDRFNVTPGWRYSLDAIAVLVRAGHELVIGDETVSTEAQLRAMWTPEAKAARAARIAAARDAAKAARDAANQAAQEARRQSGEEYAAWLLAHINHLTSTTVKPALPPGETWQQVYHAPRGTPGTWLDTGDTWYAATIDSVTVYRRDYGNACTWHAPQETIDGWIAARDDGSVAFARWVLTYYNYHVYGSDVADRLVELRGLDYYLQIARSEPWLVAAGRNYRRETDVAAHHGIPVVPVAIRPYDRVLSARLAELTGSRLGDRDYPAGVGQTAAGAWYSTTDQYNGGGWVRLTDAQCAVLGLDTTPPAVAPVAPPTNRVDPAQDATSSESFSDLFTAQE